MDFPNYQRWVSVLAQRDYNLILLSGLVIVAVLWLIDARFISKRHMPLIRTGLIATFYATLVLSVVGVLK